MTTSELSRQLGLRSLTLAVVSSSGALAKIALLSHGRTAGFIGGWSAWITCVPLGPGGISDRHQLPPTSVATHGGNAIGETWGRLVCAGTNLEVELAHGLAGNGGEGAPHAAGTHLGCKRLIDHLQAGAVSELEIALNGVGGTHRGVCGEEKLVTSKRLGHKEISVPVGPAKGIACTNRFGDDVGDAIATHWRQELAGLGLGWRQTGNQGGAAQSGREGRHKGRAQQISR